MKIIDEIEAISVSRIANASIVFNVPTEGELHDHCRAVSFHKVIFDFFGSSQLRPAARLVSRERNLANDAR